MTDTTTAPPAAAPADPATPAQDKGQAPAARRRRAAHGTTRVDRVNRAVLLVLGLGAIAAGVVILIGPRRAPSNLYADAASSVVDAADVALGLTLASCTLVVVLSLWWAWSQVSPRSGDGRISTTTVARTPLGVTTIEPAAAAHALARDLESVPGVHAARVRVISLGPSPDLIATVDLQRDVDLAAVRRALEAPLDRFRGSTGARDLDAELRLRLTKHRPPKVI